MQPDLHDDGAGSQTPRFRAFNPALGKPIDMDFACATPAEVAAACSAADQIFDQFKDSDPALRARFLDGIADAIAARRETLVALAMRETGLPQARLEGEAGRTCGQLRLFADVVREKRWAAAVVDPAQPGRVPAARSDLRSRRTGVGPVAVFGASNFPLAFSTAGGDTAAALAAGCPVVFKGHPAHPGTSRLVAEAIAAALTDCGLPAGVFALLHGPSHALGAALVRDPAIQAVAFTGSRAGGLALVEIARSRAQPIPVYAEMSSINPVILMPAALDRKADELGRDYASSLTLGAGQFCTNPGLLIAVEGPALDRFVAAASAAIRSTGPQVMLTPEIRARYKDAVARLSGCDDVSLLARGEAERGPGQGQAVFFETDMSAWQANEALAEEIFGAAGLLLRVRSIDEVAHVLRGLEGQLTSTIHFERDDRQAVRRLLPLLERKAGRIIANGWPTGVEVCRAMVHGGPFPATTDPRATAVGAAAIERFLRPICYQDFPDDLLPAPLRQDNPAGFPRLVDGAFAA